MKLTLAQQYILFVLHSQYHACWCTGDCFSQNISRHGTCIDPKSRYILFPASEECRYGLLKPKPYLISYLLVGWISSTYVLFVKSLSRDYTKSKNTDTLQFHYNVVNFLTNLHNRHPVATHKGSYAVSFMNTNSWFIFFLSYCSAVCNNVILDRVITPPDYILSNIYLVLMYVFQQMPPGYAPPGMGPMYGGPPMQQGPPSYTPSASAPPPSFGVGVPPPLPSQPPAGGSVPATCGPPKPPRMMVGCISEASFTNMD